MFIVAGLLMYAGVEAAPSKTAVAMREAAKEWLASLPEAQRKLAVVAFDDPKRKDWHWVPKPTRKGVKLGDMTPSQKELAHALLKAALSDVGYRKAQVVMEFEKVLHAMERNNPGRDPNKYFLTVFGAPADKGAWGWSFEGHHLSLNFTILDDKVVSATPFFLGTNPRIMAAGLSVGPPAGTQNLAGEEKAAFELLGMLSAEQRQTAHASPNAPRELNTGPPAKLVTPKTPAGIFAKNLTSDQTAKLREFLAAYAGSLNDELRDQALTELDAAGMESLHFAWFGALEAGKPYVVRVQGPTFIFDWDCTQSDPWNKPAAHIHAVWRTPGKDFGG